MATCKRCGLPYKADDTEFSHIVCDEPDQETWLSDEERKEKAERIRAYNQRQSSPSVKTGATVEQLLEQINNTVKIMKEAKHG